MTLGNLEVNTPGQTKEASKEMERKWAGDKDVNNLNKPLVMKNSDCKRYESYSNKVKEKLHYSQPCSTQFYCYTIKYFLNL